MAGMIVDCRDWKTTEQYEAQRRTVLLDGRRVFGVWYADTEAGIVKTYCIEDPYSRTKNRQNSFNFDRSKYPADWEIEVPDDSAASRVLRGVVTLEPWKS
jgi:hypothetical protein